MARETKGAEIAGAEPAAARVRAEFFKNRRRVTGGSLFVLIFGLLLMGCFSLMRRGETKELPRRLIILVGRQISSRSFGRASYRSFTRGSERELRRFVVANRCDQRVNATFVGIARTKDAKRFSPSLLI